MSLSARGDWQWPEQSPIARRTEPQNNTHQIDTCARCHARRNTLGDYHYGADFLDTHRPALLESPLYWPDGQIRDEVYVYGSFIQSKMHQAGVVCSNCHEPHSNQLRASGNGLCAQCHQPAAYDTAEHHHHGTDSAGSQCVECHMPETVYMGVDWRRDHSMRVPRPDLSLSTGSPNACTQCHEDKSASWALAALKGWGVTFDNARNHPALAFHGATRGDLRTVPALKALVENADLTAIQRASALTAYSGFGVPDTPQTLAMLVSSDDAILRASVARAAAALPATQRYLMLRTLIDDPVLSVRMAVAEQLAAIPESELRPKDIAQLAPLFAEYIAVQSQHLDMPSVQLQLSNFYRARGDLPAAEAALREAIHINPQLEPGIINLADLLQATGRQGEARTVLERGIAAAPAQGALNHAMGLLEIRSGNREAALEQLRAAAEAEQEGSRHRYVYAVALHDTGNPREAVALLERVNNQLPGNPETLSALIAYCGELNEAGKVGRYRAQLQGVLAQAGVR